MEIELINHASMIFHHKDIHLMTDPWLEGTVFHDGWNLLAPTKFEFSEFERINYLWFSHEHPDHFFPPNIKKIDEKYRRNITVFYQKTKDGKVVDFLRKLNFKEVIELEKNTWHAISSEFKLLCNPFSHDSWLCIIQGETTILNTNDCVVNTREAAEEIHNLTGDITLLLTQFSYGQFEGNKEEPEKRRLAVEKKIRQMDNQIAVFKPKFFIPMASFVYFCHEENFYMNDEINKIGDVYAYYKKQGTVEPVVLYLGDKWNSELEYTNSDQAIAAWNKEYDKLSHAPELIQTKSVELDELKQSGAAFIAKSEEKKRVFAQMQNAVPLVVFLSDLQKQVSLSWKGIAETNLAHCDITVSSEVLNYCLKFMWGFNTTHVNGRIHFEENGLVNYLKYESMANIINHGEDIPGFTTKVINKLKRGLKKLNS